MERLFTAVVRPVLDGLAPARLLYVGTSAPESLDRWAQAHGAELLSVVPAEVNQMWDPLDVVLVDGSGGVIEVEKVLVGLGPDLGTVQLVAVHDVERGFVGSSDVRAQGMRETIARSLASSVGEVDSVVLPGAGGLVLAAPVDAVQVLGGRWDDLRVTPAIWNVIRALEHDTAMSGVGDLAAARRIIARQDRELATLRQDGVGHGAVRRRVGRLEQAVRRARGRRATRWLSLFVEVAGPVLRLLRGDLSPGEFVRRARARLGAPGARVRERIRPAPEAEVGATPRAFASTDTGRFYDAMRPIIARGPADLVEAWAASEEALRETAVPVSVSTSGDGTADRPQPLVSIVMATRDRADILHAAIETVTDQTWLGWELLVCDDGSRDETEDVVRAVADDRVQYHRLPRQGAAAARNHGLRCARGQYVAYLDSDNLWHPRFLEVMVGALEEAPGRHAAYCRYVDVIVKPHRVAVKRAGGGPFDWERLAEENFVDLNSFVHRRALSDRLGGFNEQLVRRQDWDLVLKFSFLRDPLYVDRFLLLYQRNRDWGQITHRHAHETESWPLIEAAVSRYHQRGLPVRPGSRTDARVSIVSWDVCRNHFAKAYNLAEAVSAEDPTTVQLVGFRFFAADIFPPYAQATPEFDTTILPGCAFPAFDDPLARAVASIRGDVVYAVKPRLPSLGVALLANYHFGRPVVLELNDLESVVSAPRAGQRVPKVDLADVDPSDPRLLDPYGALWTQVMEGLAHRVPVRVTHNRTLDDHFGGGAFFLRNPKDERWFDPDRYDRDEVRRELGFGPSDRVLLFGGMVRRHKGVFELAELVERPGAREHLLVVGSRESPDQERLRARVGDRLRIVPPVDRNAMARLTLAADAVVLWLDPDVPASHFQMPYKLTDALAMRVPVFANPIGDLAELGDRGYLRLVPFGDQRALLEAMDDVEEDVEGTRRMVEAGRRLYQRQFSYQSAATTMDLVLEAASRQHGTLEVAEEFADFVARFRAAQPDGRRMAAGPLS